MRNIFFLIVIVAIGWKFFSLTDQVTLGPGVQVSEEPYQERIWSSVSREMDGYTLTDLANFRIQAKVLARKNYYLGREAGLSPTDFALGWGNMSDESILDQIDISQSGRFYRWRVDAFPIPRKEIETHSANMHLIPANDSVKFDIDRVRKGDIVEISGSLVAIESNSDNWRWRSSQTRNDTGKGACELILVQNLRVLTP